MADSTQSLGQRIREYRTNLRETQAELATRLGVCRSTIIDWERDNFPQPFGRLIQEVLAAEQQGGNTYQLQLPLETPVDLELRIAPKRASSIRVDFQWRIG